MSQTEFADRLGVSPLALSELLHEKRTVSPQMALRLRKLLDTNPERRLGTQTAEPPGNSQEPDLLDAIKPFPKKRVPEMAD